MKTLTLIRHAKSSWNSSELDDFNRPLNKRGENDAPKMGQYLHQRRFAPGLIVASPARRAQQTVEALATEMHYPTENLHYDGRLYHAGVHALKAIIGELADIHEHAAVIGHNPGLTDLTNVLQTTVIDNIPTCGLVMIEFDCESWSAAVCGQNGRLICFDYPKKLW